MPDPWCPDCARGRDAACAKHRPVAAFDGTQMSQLIRHVREFDGTTFARECPECGVIHKVYHQFVHKTGCSFEDTPFRRRRKASNAD